MDVGRPSVNARWGSWQVAQATVPSTESLPSKKSFWPSAIFSAVCGLSGGMAASVWSTGKPTCLVDRGWASGPAFGIGGGWACGAAADVSPATAIRLNAPAPGRIRWQQDPAANYIARVTWGEERALPATGGGREAVAGEAARVPALDVVVELAVDIRPVNPFDFTLDASAERVPVPYGPLLPELAAYLDRGDARFACGALADEFFGSLPREGPSVQLLVEMNRRGAKCGRYTLRVAPGASTPAGTPPP